MISIGEKMLVSENCEEYKPKAYIINPGLSSISRGCNTCVNYVRDGCSKKLFEQIGEIIKIN